METFASIETSSKVTADVKRFKITVYNKATNEIEELVMRYDKYNDKFKKHYSFYCNKGKDNEALIGAIKKIKTYPERPAVTVEVAPMVDFMFLLGIGVIVLKIEEMKQKINDQTASLATLPLAFLCTIS